MSDSETPQLLVKRLNDTAKLPTKGSKDSAGWDLYANLAVVVPSQSWALIPTGLAITVPYGCYGRVAPRSGLTLKHGLDVGAGVIDRDYCQEVGVILFNHSKTDYTVACGDRVAQLILERIEANATIREVQELQQTDRHGGFGSTGK